MHRQGSNLSVLWTKHLGPTENKEDFTKTVLNSRTALSRLHQIITDFEQDILAQQNSISDFDNPSWAHKQAFRNGQRSSLSKIKDLLKDFS